METPRRVRFDGKHWIGKKYYNDPIEIAGYNHVARKASEALGPGGIVAIPNARSEDKRYEEVFQMAKHKSNVGPIEEGKAFYDASHDVYFLKAQEINTKLEGVLPLTFLVYGLPLEKNLDDENVTVDQVLADAQDLEAVIGITGPSCIKSLPSAMKIKSDLLDHLDFFVGYSGGAAIKRGNNARSIDFYNDVISGFDFKNPHDLSDPHKVGITAVSGGHRTPKKWHEYARNGFRQTIGRSYTEIDEPSKDSFMGDLRTSLRSSRLEDAHMEPIIAEMLFGHIPSVMIGDRIRRRSN